MLYKRANSRYWYFQVKHHGKTYRRSTEQVSKERAGAVEKEFRAALPKSRPSRHGFEAAALRWLREKAHKRSYHSDVLILDWFEPRIAHLNLSEITRDVVEQLRQEKRAGCSAETVNRHMALLRAILRRARDDWEWVDKIPKVPMYPRPEKTPRWLSSEEFSSLVTELPVHLKGPAWFSIATGLRAKPILGLQWSWIARDGMRIPAKIMKAGKYLTVPLSLTAWHVLAEEWGKHDEYVFTYNNQPIKEKFTTAAWRKATVRAGLPGVRFHDLRHTWASWKLQAGVPMDALQKLGGWSTYEAMQIYAHHSPTSLQEWVDKGAQPGAHTGTG